MAEEEEEEEEDEGGKSPDTLTQEKYVEQRQKEGMSSSQLEGFLAPPQPQKETTEWGNDAYPSI